MTLPLNDIGMEYQMMLPRRVQEAPTILKTLDVMAREAERVDAAIQDIVDQSFIQTATWNLSNWEEALGLPQNPVEASDGIDDPFDGDTESFYFFDYGAAGDVSISGGTLNSDANHNNAKGMFRTGFTYKNSRTLVEFVPDATLSGMRVSAGARRLDDQHALFGRIEHDGVNTKLGFWKRVAGVQSQLGTYLNVTGISAATTYWIIFDINNAELSLEFYTANPSLGGPPDAIHTFTLTPTEIAVFGDGDLAGNNGFDWIPKGNAAKINHFIVESRDFAAVSDADRRLLLLAKSQSRFAGGGIGFVSAIQAIVPLAKVISDYSTSTVIVKLPYNPSEYVRTQIENLVDGIIPAHLQPSVQYASFIAGVSRAGDSL